jgi:hypothetical protein
MTTPTGPASGSADKPTAYRGPGAVFGGGVVLLFCLGGGLDLLIEEGTVDMPGAAVMFLVAALAFAYGVYPAAFSGPDALVVRNPLRTITIPWGIVTKLSAQLSFIAFTTTQRYTVWAVPVSIRDRRKAERARLREMGRQRDRDQHRVTAAFSFGPTRPTAAVAEVDKLAYGDQAVSEMNARREAWCDREGIDPAADPVGTEAPGIKWNATTIAPIVACAVFVIVAFIVRG